MGKKITELQKASAIKGTDLFLIEQAEGTKAIAASILTSNLQGPQGPKGEKGDTGLTGLQGPRGPQGAVGPKGDTGLTGPQGPKGEQGLPGVAGEQGPVGPKGEKGDQGNPFAIKKIYVSVEAMKADFDNDEVKEGEFVLISTENVSNEDNAKLYVKGASSFEFIVDLSGMQGIQGPKGDTGEAGPQGVQGPAGKDGVAGEQGPMGPKGETGERGLQGEVGPMGPAGPKGQDGAKGDKGEKGDSFTYEDFTPEQLATLVGPQGPAGERGPQGENGTNGSNGKEIELQKSSTHVQWRYKDETWTNLIALSEITGPQGPAGVGGGSGSGGSTITRYVPTGGDGYAFVVADGPGCSITKEGTLATLTVPEGVQVFSLQVRFLGAEIGTGAKCQIKHGMGTSWDDFVLPHVQVVNDINGNRAMKTTVGSNFNVSPDQIEITGMQTNTQAWVNLRLI